jgi:hypothetical protein
MARKTDPFGSVALLDVIGQQQKLAFAATETIWHRSLQMAMGTMTPTENVSMWWEKPTAMVSGMEKAAHAAISGKSAPQVFKAALAPMTAKASANAKRLRN